MMGMPELLNDPRFCTDEGQSRPENYETFLHIFLPWCMERTKAEITQLGQANRAVVAPVYTAKELVNDPHLKARGTFVDIDHPMAGRVKYPGAPFRSEVGFQIRRPAPMLGQHNEEVYRQLGYSKEDLVKLGEMGVI